MQILVGTGSDTPKVGICSQCCWTGKSWGLLLATLVSDKLLMGTGDAQIQVFVWVYQACRAVTFPVSLLLPPILCLALPFWFILTSTSDPGSPGSFFPWKCGLALPRSGRESRNVFSLYPLQARPKVIYPYIAPLGTVFRPRSFHRHIHMGELPDLCRSCHLSPSSHPPCPQPAPKPISREGRLWPSPCVVPAGSTGSSHPPPSATASGGTGSPCTTHLGSGSRPVPSICSVCGEWGRATSAPPAAQFSSGQPWVKAGSWQSLTMEV